MTFFHDGCIIPTRKEVLTMKNTIIINNALKYYTEDELLNNNEFFQEKLSRELGPIAYAQMIERIRNKHCMFK